MSTELWKELLAEAQRIVLLGHVHPDGDCVGSTLGLYNYLTEAWPEKTVDLYLDHPAEKFSYLKNFNRIRVELTDASYDLCITLDSSDRERLGVYGRYFDSAKKTFCIDHHVTNTDFAMRNHVRPAASSCCEVLFGLLPEEAVSRDVAECLYTGIVHDTGVFKYSSTSRRTMEIAGKLMEKGLDCARIIDDSFYRRTFVQNKILGQALLNSRLELGGQCITSIIRSADMEKMGASAGDLDGVIDQLRITAGVECAVFVYETAPGEFKASMRSNQRVDVSRIAMSYGGGGHVRAAGCTIQKDPEEVVQMLTEQIAAQL